MTALPKIAVLISTLDRPDGLLDLLRALDRQEIGARSRTAVTIVVADNSEAGNAEPICTMAAQRFALAYVHEPRRGLSFARNAALEEALRIGATHAAFIDDDELPEPGWLAALAATVELTAGTAAIGPVLPVFESTPPAWAIESSAFAKVIAKTWAPLADGYTCNAMVDLAFVASRGLRFDPRHNHTGGEDTLFFRALRAAGGTIFWSDEAVVHETIPVSRVSRGWLIRRWFRTGGTEAELTRFGRKRIWGRLYNAARGLARIGGGFAFLAVDLARHPRRSDKTLPGLYTICRGAGLIWSAFGKTYAEYRAPGSLGASS